MFKENYLFSFLFNVQAAHESAELPSSYKWTGPGVVEEAHLICLKTMILYHFNIVFIMFYTFNSFEFASFDVSQVVWKTFRSSMSSEHVLLELYSPYRPQHRTHLVVP